MTRGKVLVLSMLRAIGAPVPAVVSVLTFDDPEWSRLVQPRLSVIRQPAAAMARAAWTMLARRIARAEHPTESIALEEEIEFRESVGPPPADGARPTERTPRKG